ncbi:MAG: CHAT domain-containing protein [Cyanobacteria bacterium J06641_5]
MRSLPSLAAALFAFMTPVAIAAPPQAIAKLSERELSASIERLERLWESQYENHLQLDRTNAISTGRIRDTLARFAREDRRAALIYLAPAANGIEIVVVGPDSDPRQVWVPVSKSRLDRELIHFAQTLRHPATLPSFLREDYLPVGQKLYQWLIAPIVDELRARNIDTLLLCTGPGLRSLPFAALHDGEKFLIEEFALTRLAAFSLTDFGSDVAAETPALQDASVLAMGAGEFATLPDLPGVPVEVRLAAAGASDIWLLDRDFTRDRLRRALSLDRFEVVHLATHAEFLPGEASTSFIQFSDAPLGLDAMATLGWETAGVELLVLSACSTAVGNREAELGFAGLAYNAGVESVVASHWPVDDTGTVTLMSEFYTQLRRLPTRAEALRAAQIALLSGEVWTEQGILRGGTRETAVVLPEPVTGNVPESKQEFSHPYFWASFSLIGSPW